MKFSYSGINILRNKETQEAILFEDNTCPMCGEGKLYLHDNGESGDKLYNFRYRCDKCDFVCPIDHNTDTDEIKPIYNGTIMNFLDQFGEDIRDRRAKLIK